MSNHAVALKVTPYLRIECKFWLGDDGWNGTSEHPAITVQAGSFEHAKCDMEAALGKHIEELLKKGKTNQGAGRIVPQPELQAHRFASLRFYRCRNCARLIRTRMIRDHHDDPLACQTFGGVAAHSPTPTGDQSDILRLRAATPRKSFVDKFRVAEDPLTESTVNRI